VTLTADGRTVVSGSDDNTLRLWDAQTGRLLERLDMDEKVLSVALAEHLDRTAMVVACGRVVVRLTRCASKPQRA
jgi:WD40 repeat protein